jgi:hypothetical protein
VTLSDAGQERTLGTRSAGLVELRAEVNEDQTVRYSWRVPGGAWQAAGEPIALARFSWWKGSRPALFSYNPAGTGGIADFDWFHVAVGQAPSRPPAALDTRVTHRLHVT